MDREELLDGSDSDTSLKGLSVTVGGGSVYGIDPDDREDYPRIAITDDEAIERMERQREASERKQKQLEANRAAQESDVRYDYSGYPIDPSSSD